MSNGPHKKNWKESKIFERGLQGKEQRRGWGEWQTSHGRWAWKETAAGGGEVGCRGQRFGLGRCGEEMGDKQSRVGGGVGADRLGEKREGGRNEGGRG